MPFILPDSEHLSLLRELASPFQVRSIHRLGQGCILSTYPGRPWSKMSVQKRK